MTTPLDTPDFFALEAGESLDQIAMLVARESGPPPDELLRAARVLRGSALLAGQQPIARAAAGLEALARAHRTEPRAWDAGTGEQVAQALDEFRSLIRRVREWGEADTARAARLGEQLETLAGQRAERRPAAMPNAGWRAFVAREGALIASALDRAARALRVSPAEHEPLYTVLRRMQSLRGLAEVGELTPLPEILDGIELAIGDLTRMFAPPPRVEEVVEAASQALTRISRDVADRGQPDPESPEARRFTELLVRTFAVERDVVPIESLLVENELPIVPIERLAPDEPEEKLPIVPIERLAPDEVEERLPIVPIERLAPDEPADPLEISFTTYGRLLRERGDGPASLAALLGREAAANAAAPEAAVAIEALCYRGRAALERADAVRQALAAALDRDADLDAVQPLLQELLDLVPLALHEP